MACIKRLYAVSNNDKSHKRHFKIVLSRNLARLSILFLGFRCLLDLFLSFNNFGSKSFRIAEIKIRKTRNPVIIRPMKLLDESTCTFGAETESCDRSEMSLSRSHPGELTLEKIKDGIVRHSLQSLESV